MYTYLFLNDCQIVAMSLFFIPDIDCAFSLSCSQYHQGLTNFICHFKEPALSFVDTLFYIYFIFH